MDKVLIEQACFKANNIKNVIVLYLKKNIIH